MNSLLSRELERSINKACPTQDSAETLQFWLEEMGIPTCKFCRCQLLKSQLGC